ncbi:hypothetical protein, partial [Parasutterella sp.]|uniref:hypothetical protein n=1 Tax=Parasutterella sp. TaxID=2049037 RepID=UPI003AB5057C
KSTNGAKDLLNEAILQLQRKEYGLQEQEEQILRVALVFSPEFYRRITDNFKRSLEHQGFSNFVIFSLLW